MADIPIQRGRATIISRSSEGSTRVSADQSTSLDSGQSESTTITAASGEIWEVASFSIRVPDSYDGDSLGSTTGFDIVIETEKEGIELARVEHRADTLQDEITWVEHGSGEWHQGSDGGTTTVVGDRVKGTLIDDSTGIVVTITNVYGGASSEYTLQTPREIRFSFDKKKA